MKRGDTYIHTFPDMSSCELVKPFTGLAFWFPPVVGLAPDPAAFSLRAPGSLSLARFTFVPLSFVRLPVRVRSRSPKTSGVGRSISPTESVPPESKAGRSSGEIGTDNGGERVQPLPSQKGGTSTRLPAPSGNAPPPSRLTAGSRFRRSALRPLHSGRGFTTARLTQLLQLHAHRPLSRFRKAPPDRTGCAQSPFSPFGGPFTRRGEKTSHRGILQP